MLKQKHGLPQYTLQFKNGQVLRHQGPLVVAQFRSDARLAHVWPESPEGSRYDNQESA
jgi:hypothetical protein